MALHRKAVLNLFVLQTLWHRFQMALDRRAALKPYLNFMRGRPLILIIPLILVIVAVCRSAIWRAFKVNAKVADLYYRIKGILLWNQSTLKDQNESDLKNTLPKKQKRRKSRKNGRSDGRRIGKLLVSNKEIARGSNGALVLEGSYEGREAAVKRLARDHNDVADNEIEILKASDYHPNIVRLYGWESDQDFIYLALERCTCTLEDLIQIYSDTSENPVPIKDQTLRCMIKALMDNGKENMQGLRKANGQPSHLLLRLMRDMAVGLVHLHKLGIRHRDLKPQNVLIIIDERSLRVKISDMGISKRLMGDTSFLGHNAIGCGSSGWQAPEQLAQGCQTLAVDLFSLGCVLFYCITIGRHPFGECLERDVNIERNQKDLSLIDLIPEAEDLISHLLDPNPDQRPKALEVLRHPFFWSSKKKLSFLCDASQRLEKENRRCNSDLLKALEGRAQVTFDGNWKKKFDSAFIDYIGTRRRYRFDSVQDLLRLVRNKRGHFLDFPQCIQELVGSVPDGFNDYFATRFPRLLIEVYKILYQHCKEEEFFRNYF